MPKANKQKNIFENEEEQLVNISSSSSIIKYIVPPSSDKWDGILVMIRFRSLISHRGWIGVASRYHHIMFQVNLVSLFLFVSCVVRIPSLLCAYFTFVIFIVCRESFSICRWVNVESDVTQCRPDSVKYSVVIVRQTVGY